MDQYQINYKTAVEIDLSRDVWFEVDLSNGSMGGIAMEGWKLLREWDEKGME